jgi:hypothetical protein
MYLEVWSEAISSLRFLLLPLESQKWDFSHLPITAKLLLPSLETGKSNTYSTTNKKQGKGEKWILIGSRERRRHWRTESGN